MLPHVITEQGAVLHTFCLYGNLWAAMMNRLPQLSKTGLVGLIVFMLLPALPLVDPDYFWHLKTGEYIVAHAALPAGDVFSFTREGQPWVLHEWLFEVLLYLVAAAWGAAGVKILAAALAMSALALDFTAARRMSGSAMAAWIPVAIGALAMAAGVAPRPQLLTYLCFACFLAALLGLKYAGATRPLFGLPFLMVVWVNGHAGYAVGIALLLLFGACEWLAWLVRPEVDPDRHREQKRRLVRLTQAACLVVLASLANPGLFERWLYPLQVLGMAVNDLIQEWQSPNFHQPAAKAYLALVLLFLVSWTYAVRKPDLTELALPLFFAVLGCISARHIPLAVLALVPFTALALSRGPLAAVDAALRRTAAVRWYLARRSAAGGELGRGESALNWLVAAAVAFYQFSHLFDAQANAGREGRTVLVKGAADYLAAHRIGGRLFNQYGDGGYLIYRLAPYAKVVVDGRADMYGDQFIKDYLHVYQGGADWQAKFERLAVDLAVLPLDAPIRQLLLAGGRFREVYRDRHFSVLQRRAASASTS
jgi:hypothetical protein